MSNYNTATFDGVTLSGNLDAVIKTNNENTTNLEIGDVITFIDNYGKKGLLKITNIKAGFGNADFIAFDVQVQP